ncbi:hypothetical protein KF840_16055 [bacterium]|nr:hypothetical protein [bacterium]
MGIPHGDHGDERRRVSPLARDESRPRFGGFEALAVLAVLAPQIALGGWLLIVPDHVAFTTSQLAVLAHVALSLVVLPLAVVWSLRHIRRFRRYARPSAPAGVVRWALVGTVLLAFASGIPAIWSSQGMAVADGHAVLGAAVAAMVALHLLIERRWRLGLAVIGAIALSCALLVGARLVIPRDLLEPASPPFTYDVRPVSLYDEAAWCGSCHVENYHEWRRSTHGHAMDMPVFRSDLEHRTDSQGVDLVLVGKAAREAPGSPFLHQLPPIPDQCPMCHAPTSFFGEDAGSPLQAGVPTSDGVTCSFCHTLRGINDAHPEADQKVRDFIARAQRGEVPLSDAISPEMFQWPPFYVSAPETVRRYIGQNAANPIARLVGDYLIRWRPAMHRRDYHSPFLDTSQACQGCHGVSFDAPETPHKTYPDWEASPYNSPDASQRVECQDCHMVREATGRPVREPGRLVPWGPVRGQRRSHLFLGGNAAANVLFDDHDAAARQRELARRALRLELDAARIDGDRVRARVTLTNVGVGHGFPGMETVQRYAFLRVAAFDAAGALIAEGPQPTAEWKEGEQPSPVLFRFVDQHTLRVHGDTTVPAKESRTYDAYVDLPPGSPPVARVEVRLGQNFDPEPFLAVSGAVDLAAK